MVTVITIGPLFDGRAEMAAQDACDDMSRQVAALGAATVRDELSHVLRHQTPYYRLRVQARKDPPGWKISDAGMVYGPWLEGTESRNKTTRFKGYAAFRRMTQKINAHARDVGEAVLSRFLDRMN